MARHDTASNMRAYQQQMECFEREEWRSDNFALVRLELEKHARKKRAAEVRPFLLLSRPQ
jgi:hypothetical protein